MSETTTQTQSSRQMLRLTILCAHIVQFILAVIILGLDVYGIGYVAYSVLVCSLIVSVCTIPICAYLIVAHSLLRKLYSSYTAGIYHVWMLVFWTIDLGLAARLARLWGEERCAQDFRNGYICVPYERCARAERRDISYSGSHRTLVAGAILAASELTLWVFTASVMLLRWWNCRSDILITSSTQPPQVAAVTHSGAIPFDDMSNNESSTGFGDIFQVPAPADPWDRDVPITPEPRQQIIPSASTTDEDQSGPTSKGHERDPLANLTFGSAWTAPNKRVMKIKNANEPPHLQPSLHKNSAGEGSGPPSETQQIDWSEQSSLQVPNQDSAASSMSTQERLVRKSTMGE